MDPEKKELGKWWIWVLVLLCLTALIGMGLKVLGIFGECSIQPELAEIEHLSVERSKI